jgi:hypothetical protein
MKSQTQTIVLVLAIIGLIGGITFVRNWISTRQQDDLDLGGPPPSETRIDFKEKVAPKASEFESNGEGHYDFWFQNPNDFTVEIGLNQKSCTCSNVAALILTPEEEEGLRKKKPVSGVPQVSDASAGPLDILAAAVALNEEGKALFLKESKRWQPLREGNESPVASIPAKATGIVRLSWKGKQGVQRLIAEMWGQESGKAKTRNVVAKLEVPVVIVAPIQVFPETEAAFTLEPTQSHEFECLCWSSTRPKFQIKSAKEESNDPCIRCTFSPIGGEELPRWIGILNANLEKTTQPIPTQILCMYRVMVKVDERLPGGPQMALGPFMRKVVITTDQEDYPTVTINVQGVVRGDIKVGTDEDYDRVSLKSFSARRGTTVTVPIFSSLADVVLQVKSKKPDYLKVELQEKNKEAGEVGKRWGLVVTVPPGRAAGQMPRDSEIILTTQGQTSRLIRIPVRGLASTN